jgi:hypothetical protein
MLTFEGQQFQGTEAIIAKLVVRIAIIAPILRAGIAVPKGAAPNEHD